MSAALSRRLGRVSAYPPIVGMPLPEKHALGRLADQRSVEFEDLPERYRRLICEAEANWQRHLDATAAGHAEALDSLWHEAAQLARKTDRPADVVARRRQQRRSRPTAVPDPATVAR